MSDFSNNLSPAEAERLAVLLEEMGEAAQVIGKILRHGYESRSPFDPDSDTNREALVRELGDVLVAIEFLAETKDISETDIDDRMRVKRHRIWDFLHHQTR
jgi:NTP pyrophosphatase (non-canonical NTP hydrolase)